MRCPKCNYRSSSEGLIFCPACGFRFNPNCQLALVIDNSVYTRIFKLDKPYPQSVVMQVDSHDPLHPVAVEPNTGGALSTMRFDFNEQFGEGFHTVKVADKLRAELLLRDSPVQFIQASLPALRVSPLVLPGNGLLHVSVSKARPEIEDIMVLYYSINKCSPVRFGPAANGDYEILLKDWQRFGVDFEESDFFRTRVDFYFRFWDELELQHLTSASVSFVNRIRLREISYHAPGLEPHRIGITDKYGTEPVVDAKMPLEIYTYQNPILEGNWQRDKRYLKISETWKDLLNQADGDQVPWESFEVSLEHGHPGLDITWVRLKTHSPVDSILRINEAKKPGVFDVHLVLSIPDVICPEGKAVFHIPARINVIDSWTEPLGLGLDFGTSRTMVSLLHRNNFNHKIAGLDIDNYGEEYEHKLAKSIIPQKKEDYYDGRVGIIYPYICTNLDVPLRAYIKRELPGILRSDMESLAVLRETFEAIFETLMRRVMEYVLQTEHLIPRVTDICLGSPTVFSNNIIQQYREFLRNVCQFTLMQTDPSFEVTVWDEVWAAFYHICSNFQFDPGYYLVWDMGGGTTDTVLVDQTKPDTMPIVGFNSDFFGGKDINEQIRRILEDAGASDLDSLTEDRIDMFKINALMNGEGSFHGVSNQDISRALIQYASAKVGSIAGGLVDSMKRLGARPEKINLLPSGGGSLLKFTGETQEVITLGDVIKSELEKLLPGTSINLFDLQNNPRGYNIDPKACTCLGLSSLANNQDRQGRINRLLGFTGRCRFTIVHRDIYGVSQTVMHVGDEVYSDPLDWKDTTNMYLLFGGNNTDEKINIPIVYATREAWESFRVSLVAGEL